MMLLTIQNLSTLYRMANRKHITIILLNQITVLIPISNKDQGGAYRMNLLNIFWTKQSIRNAKTIRFDFLKVLSDIHKLSSEQSADGQIGMGKFCVKQFLMIEKQYQH